MTDQEKIIEDMARAIAATSNCNYDGMSPTGKEDWKRDARAAFAICAPAVRERCAEAARAELAQVRAARSEDAARHWYMYRDVTNAELKLAEKHCDWAAFKHAFNAVMKARREAAPAAPAPEQEGMREALRAMMIAWREMDGSPHHPAFVAADRALASPAKGERHG